MSLRLVLRIKDGLDFLSRDGRRHSDPSCDVLWTVCPKSLEHPVQPFPSNTRSHTPNRVTRSDHGGDRRTNVDLSKEVADVASAALERCNIEDIAAQMNE